MEYKTKTIKGEGFTVIIRRPILTAKEREKREKRVIDALNIYCRNKAQKELKKKL